MMGNWSEKEHTKRLELITECALCGKIYKTESGMIFHLCRKHKIVLIIGHNEINGTKRMKWIANQEELGYMSQRYKNATREEASKWQEKE